jgi:hypothetical protein
MTSAERAIAIGVLLGIAGARVQFYLVWQNIPHLMPVRGAVSLIIALFIGIVAGLTAGKEALKAAALTGFVAGVLMSAVGLSMAIRSPAVLGSHPFASAESATSFFSSLIGGTVISSWIVAVVAVLTALPILQTKSFERENL